MREKFSGYVLRKLEKHTPALLVRLQLQILLNLTAKAFHMPSGRILQLPPDRALRAYAEYTVRCINEGTRDRRRIYLTAREFGRRLRAVTGLKDPKDAKRLVFYLYRQIGITMEGCLPGEITIPACYFSRFYTPAQCSVMSCMDRGIVSGICGGGKLIFTGRITQGCDCCHACYVSSGKSVIKEAY